MLILKRYTIVIIFTSFILSFSLYTQDIGYINSFSVNDILSEKNKIKHHKIKSIRIIENSIRVAPPFYNGVFTDTIMNYYDSFGNKILSTACGSNYKNGNLQANYIYNTEGQLIELNVVQFNSKQFTENNNNRDIDTIEKARFYYDEFGNIVKAEAYGLEDPVDIDYKYDASNKVVEEYFVAEGEEIQLEYFYKDSLLIKIYENNKCTTEYTYNKNSNLMFEILYFQSKDTLTYYYLNDYRNLMVKMGILKNPNMPKDERNLINVVGYYYDENENLIRMIGSDGDYTEYIYEYY